MNNLSKEAYLDMYKKRIRKAITTLTVLCSIVTFIFLGYRFILPVYLAYRLHIDLIDVSDASAVGIIGGADGPTSIFLANSNFINLTSVFALLSIIGIIYLVITRKKDIIRK